MGARYSLTSPPQAVRAHFGAKAFEPFPPRTVIRPTEPVGIVRHDWGGVPELVLVRWGLIPSWVKEPQTFATIINARAETAADKPSFRGGLRHRRCLVPADAFTEWSGPKGARVPHLVRPRQAGPIAFAGIWEHWLGADGSEIETMAILTTAANTTVRAIHDRMPVIVAPGDYAAWLDCRSGSAVDVMSLLRPAPDNMLEIVRLEGTPETTGNRDVDPEDPSEPAQGRLL